MKKVFILLLINILLSLFSHVVIAADPLYRLMHNDQQALIIGTIKDISTDKITLKIEKQIVSSENLNESRPIEQLKLEGEIIIEEVKDYALYYSYDGIEGKPKIGDHVLVSLSQKRNNNFRVSYGMYRLDSTNYKTLNVLYHKNASIYTKMDAAALKAFINSNGTINKFKFNGENGRVYADGVLIYDANNE